MPYSIYTLYSIFNLHFIVHVTCEFPPAMLRKTLPRDTGLLILAPPVCYISYIYRVCVYVCVYSDYTHRFTKTGSACIHTHTHTHYMYMIYIITGIHRFTKTGSACVLCYISYLRSYIISSCTTTLYIYMIHII